MRIHLTGAACLLAAALLSPASGAAADLEYTLDLNAATIPLPALFRPAIDLGGRGFHYDPTWPQSLAGQSSLDLWQKEFGFHGLYRLQYNLWEISQLVGNRELQDKLLANYESVIKRVSDAGGTVILDLFSMPPGQGKVLDKKSAPGDLQVFQAIVRDVVRYFSCVRKYNVWYEIWSAPDLDTFFLGSRQEYLQMYRAAALAVKQLENEYHIDIPLGGPSTSSWFRAAEKNEIAAPEESLLFQLIRLCYHQRLPLDFISWHAYATDPKTEKELTVYKKHAIALIRDWLGYFNLNNVQLVIDEWNFDDGLNESPQRGRDAHVCASYIPARLKHMYEAGVDRQVFFALEDFHGNKEGVSRNIGAYWFIQNAFQSESGQKVPVVSVFRMLSVLGADMFVPSAKFNDEWAGLIATRSQGQYVILVYNYIDPEAARNFISRSIASFSEKERRQIVGLFQKNLWPALLRKELSPGTLAVTTRVKNLLAQSIQLQSAAEQALAADRKLKLTIKNLKDEHTLLRYRVDASCADSCIFAPEEERVVPAGSAATVDLQLAPYSVQMLVLNRKPANDSQPKSSDAAQNAR